MSGEATTTVAVPTLSVFDCDMSGVKRIVPGVYEDDRGQFIEIFDTAKYASIGIDLEFVQDDISVSRAGVLRGIHGDWRTTKLVSVLNGSAYVLVADNRPDSRTYRTWQSFELSRATRDQLLVPPGVGTAFVAREDDMVFHYKQSTHFEYGHQFTIRWDDPDWGFEWPIEQPVLSARDRAGDYVG